MEFRSFIHFTRPFQHDTSLVAALPGIRELDEQQLAQVQGAARGTCKYNAKAKMYHCSYYDKNHKIHYYDTKTPPR